MTYITVGRDGTPEMLMCAARQLVQAANLRLADDRGQAYVSAGDLIALAIAIEDAGDDDLRARIEVLEEASRRRVAEVGEEAERELAGGDNGAAA